jgi:hypothetical protein
LILITGKKYDALKELALVWLPALGTLYFVLAGIWGLPSAEQVVGTIVAIDTFVGVVLHLSSNAYAKSDQRFDGEVNVVETADKKTFSLDLKGDPNEIHKQDSLVLKVNKESA